MKKPWKSTPSAGGSARPRTGQQSIRGRISGPVPIPTPLDDEFPIRNPGTNIATPIRAEFKESQADSIQSSRERQFRSPTLPEPRRNPPQAFTHEPRSPTFPRAHGAPARLQKAEPSHTRHSFVSADAVHIRDRLDRPQRKQSTLRGAIGKLFNRRRKANGGDSPNNTDSETVSAPPRPERFRRSTGEGPRPEDVVPSLRSRERPDPRSRTRPFPGAESKRSASLPITEFDRALRSHSVRPEDIRTIESARNSISADFGLNPGRASAMRARESHLAGLSPRPASSHGRESRTEQREDDPDEIGRAITSDFAGVRRRSRSLSGLPEAEEDHNTRRRSDEIRYWRESYDPAFMSPVSSDAPEVEGTTTAAVEVTHTVAVEEQPPEKATAEPFRFEPFVGMNEVGGMKITHAANLETRINNLESRVHRLEQVLDRMCDTVPNWQSQREPPDRPAPLVPVEEHISRSGESVSVHSTDAVNIGVARGSRSSSRYRSEIGSRSSSHEETTFLDPHASSPGEDITKRPTSTATIRGATSLPSLLKDTPGSFTTDHYTNLLALIHTERSAREALEAQVKRLGNQLSVLSNSMTTRETRFDPPPTAKSFGDRSAFDHDDEEDGLSPLVINTQSQGRIVDPEDSGIGTGHGDESEYSESFETPREEGHSFGAFGEDLDKEDQAQTKAARTLSLSQLTMGRGAQSASQHTRRVI
ncbi:hypothetical protein ACHAPT_003614 [Fusarium lateritium]